MAATLIPVTSFMSASVSVGWDCIAFSRKQLFSSIRVHVLIVLHVIAGGHIVHPFLVVEVPPHGPLNSFLELQRRFPAELALQLRAVDGVAEVVAGTVGDVGDEVEVFAFLATEETVHRVDEHVDNVNVFPFVETTDVVGLGHFALMEDEVDGACVVFHIEPIAHIFAFAVDG